MFSAGKMAPFTQRPSWTNGSFLWSLRVLKNCSNQPNLLGPHFLQHLPAGNYLWSISSSVVWSYMEVLKLLALSACCFVLCLRKSAISSKIMLSALFVQRHHHTFKDVCFMTSNCQVTRNLPTGLQIQNTEQDFGRYILNSCEPSNQPFAHLQTRCLLKRSTQETSKTFVTSLRLKGSMVGLVAFWLF